MNQKALRYFLLGGVVLIWGIVIYKVIKGLRHDNYVASAKKKIKPFNYNIAKDSFILVANYPDPFIPETEESVEPAINLQDQPLKNPEINQAPIQARPEFDINSIHYHGMIANPETKIKLAVITLGGKEYTAREGDKIESVKIRKITRTGIVVFVEGKSHSIPLKTE